MSVEDSQGYASCTRIHVRGPELAKIRQALYDAKLHIDAKAPKEAVAKINEALDVTQAWT